MTAIVVHGGAGAYSPGEKHETGLRKAIEAGAGALERGGSALDAVEAAVVSMGRCEMFEPHAGSPAAKSITSGNSSDFLIVLS